MGTAVVESDAVVDTLGLLVRMEHVHDHRVVNHFPGNERLDVRPVELVGLEYRLFVPIGPVNGVFENRKGMRQVQVFFRF